MLKYVHGLKVEPTYQSFSSVHNCSCESVIRTASPGERQDIVFYFLCPGRSGKVDPKDFSLKINSHNVYGRALASFFCLWPTLMSTLETP